MATTRRDFLVSGLWVSAALPMLSRFPIARLVPLHSPEKSERVLVVVQLTGGNDGLNTLVPHRQDAYFRLRPTLALERGKLCELDGDHGLHPSMGKLAELFAEGKLSCVRGVGTPRPDRSHFRSMEIWHTADPDGPAGDRGWLGRLADQLATADPTALAAVHVGDEDLPLAMWGRNFRAPTVRDSQGFRLHSSGPVFDGARDRLLALDGGSSELVFLRGAARNAYAAAERMQQLAERETPVRYPDTELARKLALVARLVTGGFGTRVFHVSLGGFDTHARQASVHAALLEELSGALGAFQRDLEHHGAGGRVATFAFSEFGRRAEENASRGTDHGAGAPAFVLGGAVRGGLLGEPPRLDALVDGDVSATLDFRRIYTALERDWMGLEPSTRLPALDLFA